MPGKSNCIFSFNLLQTLGLRHNFLITKSLYRKGLRAFALYFMVAAWAALLTATPVLADTFWEGNAGDNWRFSGLWSNGLPDSGTSARLNNGNLANVTNDQACKNLYMAYDEYTAGVVTLKNGATLTVTNDSYVGRGGTATLRIEDGARLEDDFGYVGYAVEARGTATVDGSGSTWRSTSDMIVAHSGTGTLYVTNGGKINSYSGIIGAAADNSNRSDGEATVDGAGSWWKCVTGDMIVGYQGDGKLTIRAAEK